MIFKIVLSAGLLMLTTPTFAQNSQPKQGICGKVLWKAGNLMPSPESKRVVSNGTAVVREVYIYELTNDKQVVPVEEAGFYQKINTRLVQKLKSNSKGKFSVRLPVGYYSVFVKEEKGFYANRFDDAMNINPVQISKGKWEKTELIIDYAATY